MTAAEIKTARASAGLSQRQMASLLRVSIKTVQAWEYGVNPMPWAYYALFLLLTGQATVERLACTDS